MDELLQTRQRASDTLIPKPFESDDYLHTKIVVMRGQGTQIAASVMGTVMERVNELRDPALFLDQGQVWIAYCGGGESGIGIARVEGL